MYFTVHRISEREGGGRQTARERDRDTQRDAQRVQDKERDGCRGSAKKEEILNEERGRAGERETDSERDIKIEGIYHFFFKRVKDQDCCLY